MPSIQPQFTTDFDPIAFELTIAGTLRPKTRDDLDGLITQLGDGLDRAGSVFYLNIKRLAHINSTAFHAISHVILQRCQARRDMRVVIVTSSVLVWVTRIFERLTAIEPNISVEIYDSAFYPGQTFVENDSFIPILRTQTKMTWRHERTILPRHGLREGMLMADICCGIGDFAALVQHEFRPARLVCLDHSTRSLDYARRMAAQTGLRDVEYIYGDASQTLFEDNQFDFVTCRHSLQIFDRPDLLLGELHRICKPGGRVYITNEKNSHCLGEPGADSIQWTYNEVAKLFAYFDMDVEMGPKSRRLLGDSGFDDIRVETFMVTNLDGDPQDFADIITAWENVYAGDMSARRGDTPEFNARFRQGFRDHIAAALNPRGYAGWPIWAASGRKAL